MRFGPKPAVKSSPSSRKFPKEVKRRAFRLYLTLTDKLEKKYTLAEIAKKLQSEFPAANNVTDAVISNWAKRYFWASILKDMVDKAVAGVDETVSSIDCYRLLSAQVKPNFQVIENLITRIDGQKFYANMVGQVAPTIAAYITEMFILNKEHFNALMERKPPVGLYAGRFVYDVGKDGERKQYWDMYLAGVTKMLEIHGYATKKTATKATVTDQFGNKREVSLETEGTDSVVPEVNDPNIAVLLMQIAEMLKQKGVVNALPGPDNSDFPSEQGDPNFIPGSTEGADNKS